LEKPKLAIFDWNGTLLDDLPMVYQSVVAIFRHYNLPPPTLSEYREEIEADFMKFYRNHGMPEGITGKDLNAIRKRYFQEHWNDALLRPHAEELLLLCRNQLGIPTALVSAEMREILIERLRSFKLMPLFDEIRGNSWNKEEALIATLDIFGTKAEDAFYLDDTYDGLMAAKNVGIKTIGFSAGYHSEQRVLAAKPDFGPVTALREVMTLLRQMEEM